MIDRPIYGYVQIGIDGLPIWNTFTTNTPPVNSTGWVYTFKVPCVCGVDYCGEWISPSLTNVDGGIFNHSYTYTASGNIDVKMRYGAKPTRYRIELNGVLVYDTVDYGGLVAYQSLLDSYTLANSLPSADVVDPFTLSTNETIAVAPGDIINVTVFHASVADFMFMYDCIDTPDVDCVMTVWSNWSAWTVDPMNPAIEVRTRTRSIITPAEGSGEPCGPTSETQHRLRASSTILLESTLEQTFEIEQIEIVDEDNSVTIADDVIGLDLSNSSSILRTYYAVYPSTTNFSITVRFESLGAENILQLWDVESNTMIEQKFVNTPDTSITFENVPGVVTNPFHYLLKFVSL